MHWRNLSNVLMSSYKQDLTWQDLSCHGQRPVNSPCASSSVSSTDSHLERVKAGTAAGLGSSPIGRPSKSSFDWATKSNMHINEHMYERSLSRWDETYHTKKCNGQPLKQMFLTWDAKKKNFKLPSEHIFLISLVALNPQNKIKIFDFNTEIASVFSQLSFYN